MGRRKNENYTIIVKQRFGTKSLEEVMTPVFIEGVRRKLRTAPSTDVVSNDRLIVASNRFRKEKQEDLRDGTA